MAEVKITLQVELDGHPIDSFPIVRRLELAAAQTFEIAQAGDGDAVTFHALPTQQPEIDVLVVRTDRAVMLRLNGQTDKGILLNAGGVLLIFDGKIDAGAGILNAKVNNNSALVATLAGLAAGT